MHKIRPTILLSLLFAALPAMGDEGDINIRGSVYGGGKAGAVGTSYITSEDLIKDDLQKVTLDAGKLTDGKTPETVTHITITSGTVTTIFGGGERGRTFGGTEIKVQGTAQVGRDELKNSVQGGIYGGGDGDGAAVFGSTNVEISGGTIPQKVYGGGNLAPLVGNTYVHLLGGNIYARGVFAGARMADIYGHSHVHVDGENLMNDLVLNAVYGGNDVSGSISLNLPEGSDWPWVAAALPTQLKEAAANGVDESWDAFVQTTNADAQGKKIFIGQLFGGGDGDYSTYNDDHTEVSIKNIEWNGTEYKENGTVTYDIDGLPTVEKTYIEIEGGTIGYTYGGGNAATVTEATVISINNASTVVTSVKDANDEEMLTPARMKQMGLNLLTTDQTKADYQFSRVFGGNNKADMHIRPTWKLTLGQIDNLYSGGNAGDMTHPRGIVLPILPESNITVNNVYGGCRMADVHPEDENGDQVASIPEETDGDWKFPADYAARVLIEGGNINNVYGGCDVSGSIYFGTDVRIMSSVWGNVYGGGNGAYAYTDQEDLADDDTYGDFYYGDKVVASEGSAMSLNKYYRPNVENTFIHITGSKAKDTYIGGVFCGGNSATLRSMAGDFNDVKARLHIGSYVVADSVFLGSNGQYMKDRNILEKYADRSFSSINLTDTAQLNSYMRGVAVYIHPELSFDPGYVAWSTKIGSLYCGGNVGSMKADGLFTLPFDRRMVIYDKVVGGCNNANIPAQEGLIAFYEGGITGLPDADGRKLVLNFDSLKLEPKYVAKADGKPQWDENGRIVLNWSTEGTGKDMRLLGGNVYGGCYNSGHVNGDVEINLLSTTCYRDEVFATEESPTANSGITLDAQGEDVLGTALNVFGAGYGADSEIWGNTTINLQEGYTFQVFGGGMEGVVGKGERGTDGTPQYAYGAGYSTTVNLCGSTPGVAEGAAGDSPKMAETEYIYGGGFEGLVTGNSYVNLGDGRIYDAFGGSCNADILGHTETRIGKTHNTSGAGATAGFPYIRDNIYGGNDLGGAIGREASFTSSARSGAILASSYVEYYQGRVDSIFGGCYGSYDYTDADYAEVKRPTMASSFVNLSPIANQRDSITHVYGGSEGYIGYYEDGTDFKDYMQERSYVLVNLPQTMQNFTDTEVFGAGAYCGVGMGKTPAEAAANPDAVTAVVDLLSGEISAAYGGSFKQGITRRTEVNVPATSTIKAGYLFGGAYGEDNKVPCDVYEAHVNYSGADAVVTGGAIYGGNNNCRRTLYGIVDVNSTVWSNKGRGYQATIYGAGYGADTWSQYTEVNLNDGALVDQVYGGGNEGMVLNKESVAALENELGVEFTLGPSYTDNYLDNALAKMNALGKAKTNTNVNIYKGATVGRYAYGAGYGTASVVSGSTFIGLQGGTVKRDLYAGGEKGGVRDKFALKTFTATTNAYIEGGTVRNCYGGGYEGHVGYHDTTTTSTADDIDAESNVVIGIPEEDASADYGFYKGVPTVQRNAFAGGEGGAVFGTASITLNNGYIGYVYEDSEYKEKLDDETQPNGGIGRLEDCGSVFGGGYDDLSSVDIANVYIYGGLVRNSVYGGGELAVVGRGKTKPNDENSALRELDAIHKAGETHVHMYDGHVLRDVFGGGKGYNVLNYGTSHNLFTDGYVFGQTEVFVYGGEIGTEAGVANGYGNVFGGGNISYVYSGHGKKFDDEDGYYYQYENDAYILDNGEKLLTKDCRVVVEPWCRVKSGSVSYGGNTYTVGDWVPTDYLNTLGAKSAAGWKQLDDKGITIHNAVFAGGNIASITDQVFANTYTVMGNVTASVCDVYNRDLISIGTERNGGLYGDGNLTLVDGYRELCIQNYGTDYYNLEQNISLANYEELTAREKAYYELKYKCKEQYTSQTGKTYAVDDIITEEDYKEMSAEEQAHWERAGVYSRYAGRPMNTIQRADFAGVWGCRMVLQGAPDRVASKVDYTNYTINRVGELSLNQMANATNTDKHGNYFGIYSIVNFLGGLTSDVDFSNSIRTTDTSVEANKADGKTYEEWKAAHLTERNRNNGTSQNQVALANGVYLELTTEKSTGVTTDTKDWGYITGVIELDLINVMQGVGGGYVYAKNVHGVRSSSGLKHTILSDYNQGAVTSKAFTYETDDSGKQPYETSGNFIHNTHRIVDDCYPTSGRYLSTGAVPAHYWYIHGDTYVYEQTISAYTGAPNAFTREQHIPLNITAASHGRLELIDVKTNYYAYYADTQQKEKLGELTKSVIVNNQQYQLNDPISYWELMQLSESDQKRFVGETYVTVAACTLSDGTTLDEGYVMLPAEYQALKAANATVHDTEKDEDVPFDDVFHPSNNLSHDGGYALTFSMTNPNVWDIDSEDSANPMAPQYRLKSGEKAAVYGQQNYTVGDIINNTVYTNYETNIKGKTTTGTQATMEQAYVTTSAITLTRTDGTTATLNAGAPVVKSDYTDGSWSANSSSLALAYVCTATLELPGEGNTVLNGELVSLQRINELKALEPTADTHFSKAYYCTSDGLYGGQYFEPDTKYIALQGWCSLSETDREHFEFCYDALDLLLDPLYQDGKNQLYDADGGPYTYSAQKPIDYRAIYQGADDFSYTFADGTAVNFNQGTTITGEQYEQLPNDKYHYSPIQAAETVYVVKELIVLGNVPYSPGRVMGKETYDNLTASQKAKVDVLTGFSADDIAAGTTYYYCWESYSSDKSNCTAGTYISKAAYDDLQNRQAGFTIEGVAPIETSTLYVASHSSLYDLTKDRIVTVIYQYTYEESDESGNNANLITERHIVNIHLEFKSGEPVLGLLAAPPVILPGNTIGLERPSETGGAYETLSRGWDIFPNETDALRHKNGTAYVNNFTPMYWYQDGYYVAYYVRTYLGKTYSNPVRVTVANYHDLDDVLSHTDHHLYIDQPAQRPAKIYLDDRTCQSDNTKNELDLLRDLFDLSLMSESEAEAIGHQPLDEHVKGLANLDFILQSDLSPKAYTSWAPIGTDSQCFEGTLHGDGHTLSGLSQSLFGQLCGSVYNLGVSGSFTGSGVADGGSGRVENCWVSTTGTTTPATAPVFGGADQENNYYYTGQYTAAASGATPMNEAAFRNGTVAYNLNGFYLKKRHDDHSDDDHTADYAYVTGRYSTDDHDYLYADGNLPDTGFEDVRYDAETKTYTPIYPDDYLFFGQRLSYGHTGASGNTYAHQSTPAHLAKQFRTSDTPGDYKTGTQYLRLFTDDRSNRVYRAPAYFRSSTMQVAHYNADAIFCTDGHQDMTAIDFTGFEEGSDNSAYKASTDGGIFYRPALDDDGLVGFQNIDLTQNLLAYVPNSGTTRNVVRNYMNSGEPAFAFTDDAYLTVDALDAATVAAVRGHAALRTSNGKSFTASSSHFIVDRQDFWAPFAYKMGSGRRAWHQRTPQNHVSAATGWEAVSLPFTAEHVTTQQKGELTHFYSATDGTATDAGRKGHEYWLRAYDGVAATDGTTVTARFTYPAAQSGSSLTTPNTFLWDYYYSQEQRQDANTDEYQQYYAAGRTFEGYPYLQDATPYLIGFPGSRYYEFDLSGNFVPENTYGAIDQLDAQTITFASAEGAAIAASHLAEGTADDGYTFHPNYLNREVPAGTFVLDDAGSSFAVASAATQVGAFRPYFTTTAGARTRSIVFSDETSQLQGQPDTQADMPHGLDIRAARRRIVVTSYLADETQVTIVTPAGVTLDTFTIQPGETVATRVALAGVYLVNNRKLSVR